MPYTYTLSALIPAAPDKVYDAWLDSQAHSAMTGAKAMMSRDHDGVFSAWNGYINGRNLELARPNRIVQSWRTTRFTQDDADSVITLTLTETAGGTLLALEHANVPDDHTSYEQGGWQKSYFAPMQAYFAALDAPPPAAPAAAAEPPAPARPPQPRKTKAKPSRPKRRAAAPAKPKPAKRRAKPVAAKRGPKVKAKPKRPAKAKRPTKAKPKAAPRRMRRASAAKGRTRAKKRTRR